MGLSGASSSDIWSAGSYNPTESAELQTLAIHWNGTELSRIATPNVDKYFNEFLGVTALKSNYVWAVGYAYTKKSLQIRELVEHWNGKTGRCRHGFRSLETILKGRIKAREKA